MFSKLKNLTEKGGASTAQNDDDGQGESLTTVLPTHEDRTNLLLLIADLTEQMRSQIVDAFDPNKTEAATPLKIGRRGSTEQPRDDESLKIITKQDRTEENLIDLSSESVKVDNGPEESTTTDATADPEAQAKRQREKANKALEKRTKDLEKPENVQLKEAALKHFDEWRDKVLQRVGEAVNQRVEREDTSAATPLRDLNEARRILIMHSILLLLLGLEAYPAQSRVLMLRLADHLGLSMELLAQDEMSTAKGLLEAAKMNADEETQKKVNENSSSRKWKVGLGALGGALLIGITGGLAAPLLAAGVGTVMGGLGLGATATAGYLGALAGSAPLVGVLFGAYGAKMSGKLVDEYAKEVEDFGFLPVNKPSLLQRAKHDDKNTHHLRVAVCISGWLAEENEVVLPWQVISGRSTEAFALRWELKALLRLGHALSTYIKSYAWGWAKKEILSRTIFASLVSALILPYGIAKAARVIDNPFSVAVSRSDKAGVVLADALINKIQGERPVTLIGYSLGARVIYSCLAELADRKAFGLVENVCLMGGATPSDPLIWRRIRSVVGGRVINVFSPKDYLLAFLYRANSLQYGIAGLQAIPDVQGVENVDVGDLVEGHTQYRFLVGSILRELKLEDIEEAVVENQIKKLRRQEKEDKEEREKREAQGGDKSTDDEAAQMERDVEESSSKKSVSSHGP